MSWEKILKDNLQKYKNATREELVEAINRLDTAGQSNTSERYLVDLMLNHRHTFEDALEATKDPLRNRSLER